MEEVKSSKKFGVGSEKYVKKNGWVANVLVACTVSYTAIAIAGSIPDINKRL